MRTRELPLCFLHSSAYSLTPAKITPGAATRAKHKGKPLQLFLGATTSASRPPKDSAAETATATPAVSSAMACTRGALRHFPFTATRAPNCSLLAWCHRERNRLLARKLWPQCGLCNVLTLPATNLGAPPGPHRLAPTRRQQTGMTRMGLWPLPPRSTSVATEAACTEECPALRSLQPQAPTSLHIDRF
ncbi:uncharacterized protein LOC144100812 [Amblyomma americanum]